MLIRKVSEQCHVSIDTLRYYDKIGLLTPKRKNNIRYYTEEDIEKLKSIIAMKNMMFSLEEIKDILKLDKMIDDQLKNHKLDIKLCEELHRDLIDKYECILEKEKDIKKVKCQIQHILNKVDDVIEGEEKDGRK